VYDQGYLPLENDFFALVKRDWVLALILTPKIDIFALFFMP
jgi:hypothetical protein